MDPTIRQAIQQKVAEEPYARQLGLRLIELEEGHAVVEMTLIPEMENIFEMAHGGAIFSLIDEAFELAVNSHGTIAVALSMSVTYTAPPRIGDLLRAEAREVSRSRRTGTYSIQVKDGEGALIAVCQAVAYRKDDPLPFLAS